MSVPLDFQLVTERCRLRCPSEADFPHVFSATRHAGFNDGMPWEPPANEAELREPFERALRVWQEGEGYSFTIETKTDAVFLGRISLRKTPQPTVWSIGFWMHPTQQGKGYTTEAAQTVVRWGFEHFGADAIEACYATWNVRSKRVLERIGMTEVEYLPHGFQKRGAWVPEYRMRVERSTNACLERGAAGRV